jgi:hypothetical protein
MSALVFYFVSRCHSKFKFAFDWNSFESIKIFVKRTNFSSLFLVLGRIPAGGPAGPASPSTSHFPCGSTASPTHGPHWPSQDYVTLTANRVRAMFLVPPQGKIFPYPYLQWNRPWISTKTTWNLSPHLSWVVGWKSQYKELSRSVFSNKRSSNPSPAPCHHHATTRLPELRTKLEEEGMLSPATTTACCCPKVSKMDLPRHPDVVGQNRIVNWAPKWPDRGAPMRPYGTTVSVLSAIAPSAAPTDHRALHHWSWIGHQRLDLGIPLRRFNPRLSSSSWRPWLDWVS